MRDPHTSTLTLDVETFQDWLKASSPTISSDLQMMQRGDKEPIQ
jgi:hypothetical protein